MSVKRDPLGIVYDASFTDSMECDGCYCNEDRDW